MARLRRSGQGRGVQGANNVARHNIAPLFCYGAVMSDNRPRSGNRNSSLVAPLILGGVLVAVFGAVLLSPPRRPPVPSPVVAVAVAPPAIAPAKVEAPPVLTRNELVQTANSVAMAFADGVPLPTETSPLVGRRFRLALPFGCDGAGGAAIAGPASAQIDPLTRNIKLAARPIDLTSLPLVQRLPEAKTIESVEGFWIPRPWSQLETCPPPRQTPVPATETPPAAQTLGLAQYFEVGGSRTDRRAGRPYELTRKLDRADSAGAERSYALVLEGRIVGYEDGRALRCWSESPDHRPVCLYAVRFDRVAFEDPSDGQVLADWSQ